LSTSNELFSAKAATGIEGLDDILAGGLSRGQVFLLEGEPGTGKTTVALHFLLAGARADERSLYITLSETERGVVIDSINGYQAAMPEENALVLHMYELLLYLNRRGAATFMTVAQHGWGGDMQAPVDITYLADVILLRYLGANNPLLGDETP
jgi:hypothetical protein